MLMICRLEHNASCDGSVCRLTLSLKYNDSNFSSRPENASVQHVLTCNHGQHRGYLVDYEVSRNSSLWLQYIRLLYGKEHDLLKYSQLMALNHIHTIQYCVNLTKIF